MVDPSTAVHLFGPHTKASSPCLPHNSPRNQKRIDKSGANWDCHEPETFSRCHGHGDHELLEGIDLEMDLVEVAESAYHARRNLALLPASPVVVLRCSQGPLADIRVDMACIL